LAITLKAGGTESVYEIYREIARLKLHSMGISIEILLTSHFGRFSLFHTP
jgi:hypothetical protein